MKKPGYLELNALAARASKKRKALFTPESKPRPRRKINRRLKEWR